MADTRQEMIDLLSSLASALSAGDGLAFLSKIDHKMPEYDTLQRNILALTGEYEISAAIDILQQEGDEHSQKLQLDWTMQIRAREETGPVERRRETVTCGAERVKKKWKVVSLEPLSFFAPPRPVQA